MNLIKAEIRKCKYCGNELPSERRITMLYCNPTCRTMAFYKRKFGGEVKKKKWRVVKKTLSSDLINHPNIALFKNIPENYRVFKRRRLKLFDNLIDLHHFIVNRNDNVTLKEGFVYIDIPEDYFIQITDNDLKYAVYHVRHLNNDKYILYT